MRKSKKGRHNSQPYLVYKEEVNEELANLVVEDLETPEELDTMLVEAPSFN